MKAYHGALQEHGIAPARPPADDAEVTEEALKAAAKPSRSPARSPSPRVRPRATKARRRTA